MFPPEREPEGEDPEITTDQTVTFTATEVTEDGVTVKMNEPDITEGATVKMTKPAMDVEITESGITVRMTDKVTDVPTEKVMTEGDVTEPAMAIEITESGITVGMTDKVTDVPTEKVMTEGDVTEPAMAIEITESGITVGMTDKVTDVPTEKNPDGVTDADLMTGDPNRMDYIMITPESDESDTDMSDVTEQENIR